MSAAFKEDIQSSGEERLDMGTTDTARYAVMTHIINLRYDKAIDVIKDYITRESDYPKFKEKSTNYANRAIKIIEAIKLKRVYSQNPNLTAARNQEVLSRVREHLKELSYTLSRMEQVERDLRIVDAKATVLFVKTTAFCILVIVSVYFFQDFIRGMGQTAISLFDDYYTRFLNFLFR